MAITVTSDYIYDSSTGTYWPNGLNADGVTEDQVKLQAVIDAATITGGVIVLPPGTIYISASGKADYIGIAPNWRPAVILKSNIHLMGSRGTIIKMKTETAGATPNYVPICLETDGHDIIISNVTINGGYPDGTIEMGFRNTICGLDVTDVCIRDCVFYGSPGKHIFFFGSASTGTTWNTTSFCTRITVEDCEGYDFQGNAFGVNVGRDVICANCSFHDRYTSITGAESVLMRHDDGVRIKNLFQTLNFGEDVLNEVVTASSNPGYPDTRLYQFRNVFISPDGRPSGVLGANMVALGNNTNSDLSGGTYARHVSNISCEGILSRWTNASGDGDGKAALAVGCYTGAVVAGCIICSTLTAMSTYGVNISGNDTCALGIVVHNSGVSSVAAAQNIYLPGNVVSPRHTAAGCSLMAPTSTRGNSAALFCNSAWSMATSNDATGKLTLCGNHVFHDGSYVSNICMNLGGSVTPTGTTCCAFTWNITYNVDATDYNITVSDGTSVTTRNIFAFNRCVNTTTNGNMCNNTSGTKNAVHKNSGSRSSGAATFNGNDTADNYSST